VHGTKETRLKVGQAVQKTLAHEKSRNTDKWRKKYIAVEKNQQKSSLGNTETRLTGGLAVEKNLAEYIHV
jgi:hypothetical protein